MKRVAVIGVCCVAVIAVAGTEDGVERAERRAAGLVARMTLEEKASQLCNRSAAIPRLGIPACDWWNEALHGVARSGIATVFPQNIGRAATFDADLERRVGEAVGVEARAKANEFARRDIRCRYAGAMLLSPTVNLFRDPRWGRGQETFGEDPFLSGTMGAAFVRGVQGDDPRFLRATACAKHFAVHSGPEESRRTFDAVVTARDLREYYLRPFRDLVRHGRVASVMCSYNAVNGVPATENRGLMTDVLRDEWGFRGYVITDSDGVFHLAHTRRLGSEADCMCRALQAGLDVEIGPCWKTVPGLVRDGRLTEKTLDEKVTRLLAHRIRLGLLAGAGEDPYAALGAADVDTLEHRALARTCAEESLVLVKNDGVLPLDRSRLRRVCVTGPRALDELAMYGIYYGTAGYVVPALSGIAKAAGPGVMVNDLELTDSEDHPLDATVVCIGLNSSMEGEEVGAADANAKSDRGSTALPAGDLELLRRARSGIGRKPLIAVCFGGSPLDLRDVNAIADATILAWYPGEEGGTAVGKAIFGDVNPAGRLPVTFPLKGSDIPPMESYALEGRTYLYATREPLYPFGYGLSYTHFVYSLPTAKKNGDGSVVVSATVRNVGSRAGDEVVQLYVRAPKGSGDRRRHHLEGFRRIRLAAGESRTVSFALDAGQLSVFDADGRTFLPRGETTVFIGGGQPGFAETVSASADGLL